MLNKHNMKRWKENKHISPSDKTDLDYNATEYRMLMLNVRKKVSEYDQEIHVPQSQTADKLVAS